MARVSTSYFPNASGELDGDRTLYLELPFRSFSLLISNRATNVKATACGDCYLRKKNITVKKYRENNVKWQEALLIVDVSKR